MRHPLHVAASVAWLRVKNAIRGRRRYPFVLMLEPLYTCNLACIGCTPERHTGKISDRLAVNVCLKAVDDCGAPMVSLCGGEPTLYPELAWLIDGIVSRKRHVYLCTNGLTLDTKVFGIIPAQKRLTINVHLDGLRETHDMVCAKAGVFDLAIAMIAEAKERGYHVMTNTTVFKETQIEEIDALCELLAGMRIDGMLVSPGYQYHTVARDIFLTRKETAEKFEKVLELGKKYPLTSTPMFLEFAAGRRNYSCSPWSTVTFTPRGWKAPCYLIGRTHTFDWKSFWEETDWDYWESRQDVLCQSCAMHSGFEASAVMNLTAKDVARLLLWGI